MILITILVLYAVVMRYLLTPPQWGEAVALLMFGWLVFVGASYATITGSNIAVGILLDALPRTMQRILLALYSLLSAAFFVIVAWKGIPLFKIGFRNEIFSLGIPTIYATGGLFVGCVLMAIGQLRWFWIHGVRGDLASLDLNRKAIE